MVKISLIVTCYNLENYISKCLKSIKEQTIKDYEVLIINDGSTDDSKKVIEEFIKGDNRFNCFEKKNEGVSLARNYGLKKAQGKYICFIDGDDYLEKTYLEVLLSAIETEDYDFSICNIKRIYKNKVTYNKIDDQIVKECRYPALWNKLCKKEIFDKYNIQFLNNVWYEDLAVGTELYLVSEKYITTDAYVYNYMQYENSLIKKKDNRIFDIYSIMEEIERFAKENNVYDKKFTTIEFIHIYHILIGTIFRASFHKDFSLKMIREIYNYVNHKYPNWSKNAYLKNLPFSFKVFLKLVKWRFNLLIYFLLKLGNKKMNL